MPQSLARIRLHVAFSTAKNASLTVPRNIMSRLPWIIVVLAATLVSGTDPCCSAADKNPPPGQKSIAAILDAPTEISFVERPLYEVVKYLEGRHKISIRFDEKALADMNLGTDTLVTKSLKNTSLRSALEIMLRELGLCYIIEDDVVLITTPKAAKNRRLIRVYPIQDLLAQRSNADGPNAHELVATCKELIKAITATIEPESWTSRQSSVTSKENEKTRPATSIAGTPAEAPTSLVVQQSPEVHQEIAELLTCLRRVKAGDGRQRVGIGREMTDAETKINQVLDSRTDLDFDETPLFDVVDYLKDRFKIEIQIDKKCLPETSIFGGASITRKFKDVPLRTALRLMLGDGGLTFIIQDDVLLITTPEIAANQLSTKVYPLPPGTKPVRVDSLLKDIHGLVKPHSHGGVAAVELAVPILTVRHVPKVHQEIVNRLARPEFQHPAPK